MKTETIILDGKPTKAVIIGDGMEQITHFNTIAEYARSHTWKFYTDTQPSKFHHMTDNIIMGDCEKYRIIAIESQVPGIKPPFHYPCYQSYVQDKTTGQEITRYGTISHYFWDLLQEIKDKQK